MSESSAVRSIFVGPVQFQGRIQICLPSLPYYRYMYRYCTRTAYVQLYRVRYRSTVNSMRRMAETWWSLRAPRALPGLLAIALVAGTTAACAAVTGSKGCSKSGCKIGA